MSLPAGPLWRALGASVRGASHRRLDTPNQDALGWWPRGAVGDHLAVAVADGHGGPEYTRSHIGAAYGVRIALRVLSRDLLSGLLAGQTEPNLAAVKRTCEEWLPRVLVRSWQERIRAHAARYPPEPERPGPSVPREEEEEAADLATLRLYGTTLLATLLTPHFHLYVQLGDGDFLTVAADGRVSRPPLPVDGRLLGNETTSLCLPAAWRHVRLHFQPLVDQPPALILLATDGYANSFVNGEAFGQVGSDLLAVLRRDGARATAAALPDWLTATSSAGSGDDISVGLALRLADG